jgi:aminoglycoside phosphotransferase (APT) family kinase protein
LSVLWQAFPLAPHAFLYCDAPDVLGADFFVMERRSGVVVRRVIPPEFGGGRDPEANRKLSEVLIDTLVDFHAVDPEDAGLGDLGKPDGFLRRQVEGWADRFERSKTREVEIADELHDWLLDNLPASPAPTLLHNDWKLDNMALARNDPGRCVAVYDWDMCTRGDPLCDLASLMTSWRDEEDTVLAMPTTSPGFLRRADAIARYGERSGRSLDDIAYYLVFGMYKNAVVLQQIYSRYARGQTVDERFAAMGEGAADLFQRAARLRD